MSSRKECWTSSWDMKELLNWNLPIVFSCFLQCILMHYFNFHEIFQELNVLLEFVDFSKFLQCSSKMTNWGIVPTCHLFGLYLHEYIKTSYLKLTWLEHLLRGVLMSVWVVLKVSIGLYMLWMNNLKLTDVPLDRRKSIFQLHSFKKKFFLLSKQTVVLGGFLYRIQIGMWNYCVQLQLQHGFNYD